MKSIWKILIQKKRYRKNKYLIELNLYMNVEVDKYGLSYSP